MKKITHLKTIATEAKKMGISVAETKENGLRKALIFNDAKLFVVSGDNFYPDVQRWLPKLMNDKLLTQKLLKRKGYNTIRTISADPRDFTSLSALKTKIKKSSLTYPAVIKPNDGLQGKDIFFLTNQAELLKAAEYFYENNRHMLIQPVNWSHEYRITLIANKPVMVHKKQFPAVIGNGTSSVAELLDEQSEKLKDANFIKWNLKQKNLTLRSILASDERFETHIIKKRTPEYFITEKFPEPVVRWGKQILKDMSCKTIAIDFTSGNGLKSPDQFVIIELNACPGWTYAATELGDYETPKKIARHILKSYFK